ncbi:MAG TPA: hypothetical protein DDX19_25240 [Rhodopirellula baltica]|uniref:Uncharacterized protein n=1 Tax=Rhodopirellula baltica (strain DSM 10527 / NCIMB 13988 / SH1) TaxID=243090 RepID=Q7UHM4_RHOBA|nr:hypothetical protein RB13109 [Rhodopirellula baltica SH 1]HBE65995.1 hypothetical protein [Rhodopirellula baltica]
MARFHSGAIIAINDGLLGEQDHQTPRRSLTSRGTAETKTCQGLCLDAGGHPPVQTRPKSNPMIATIIRSERVSHRSIINAFA